jgi:hypothetical protein
MRVVFEVGMKRSTGFLAVGFLAGWVGLGHSQTTNDKAVKLPDAPTPTATPTASPTGQQAQLPIPQAGDSVFAPLAVGPETMKIRTEDWIVVTAGPRAFIYPAIVGAVKVAFPKSGYPPDWRDGAGGYGRNLGDSMASKATMQTGRYLTGALLREDYRYRPAVGEHGWRRFGHALRWTIWDASDGGKPMFAFANVSGAVLGGLVGDFYLPPGYNDVDHAAKRAGIRMGSFAFENVSREFAPEIFRALKWLHLPTSGGFVPEWWTGSWSVTKP